MHSKHPAHALCAVFLLALSFVSCCPPNVMRYIGSTFSTALPAAAPM